MTKTLTPVKMTFALNPYDDTLNLGKKDDRKLFTDECKGLKAEDLFDWKKQNYEKIVKLIEGDLNATCTMEVLEVKNQMECMRRRRRSEKSAYCWQNCEYFWV